LCSLITINESRSYNLQSGKANPLPLDNTFGGNNYYGAFLLPTRVPRVDLCALDKNQKVTTGIVHYFGGIFILQGDNIYTNHYDFSAAGRGVTVSMCTIFLFSLMERVTLIYATHYKA
jgi:hypothetical protein